MPIFNLKLEKTYYDKGFFNVTVDYDRYVRKTEGPIAIELGAAGERIVGRIDRHANKNGTARIYGNAALRDWFQRNFKVLDTVAVDLRALDLIPIKKL